VDVVHRDRLAEVQADLAAIAGVTVLINDEECATELRRRRKRGLVPVSPRHIFINERVCEGCGDCGEKSNCLSVQPVMTEYGRKTRIHQASCNEDESCLRGECPSFITVVPAHKRRWRKQAPVAAATVPDIDAECLPAPMPALGADVSLRITGIGGTGVVTVSHVLSTAAGMSGIFVQSLDQTGLAQKGGAVVSDLRFSHVPVERSNRIGPGQADLYLGCDLLVAVAEANLEAADPRRTHALVSTSQVPTGAMVVDPAVHFPELGEVTERLDERMKSATYVDARTLVTSLFGDDQYANVLLVGMATQMGLLPLPPEDIERALTLNGVAVAANLQAFRRGRQYIADPQGLQAAIDALHPAAPSKAIDPRAESIARMVALAPAAVESSPLAGLVLRRVDDLIQYQGMACATGYAQFVERVRAAEASIDSGSTRLTTAVATYLYKLMAYKDEYEVARLSIDRSVRHAIEDEFGTGATYSFMLQPPLMQALGLKRKLRLPRSLHPVLWLLARMRFLRGTLIDPFGYARVRRIERALIVEYRRAIEAALASLSEGNLDEAVALASLPDMVRGYEAVKLRNVDRYREALRQSQARLQDDRQLEAAPA
jgi:indolepyruvate ferredoxin oxidoreductase